MPPLLKYHPRACDRLLKDLCQRKGCLRGGFRAILASHYASNHLIIQLRANRHSFPLGVDDPNLMRAIGKVKRQLVINLLSGRNNLHGDHWRA
jgi:hypothetical protein